MVRDIGQRIAELRRERGMNQEELAELATLSRISIARYETGKIEPGAKALGRIADALEVSTDILLGRSEDPPDPSDAPRTFEARAVSAGMDDLPQEQRQMILNMVRAMYPNVFDKKGKEDDDSRL